ncbi:MAG: hypothetical protein NKF70_13585 [Methanobacterium sp. ERen5]|nr:MAG: hypothetical protein NKF70_13585 [Methanobacterium sp. ERen5]
MEHNHNNYWGILGILGLLGYVLQNQIYYIFFLFFFLFLFKTDKYEKNNLPNIDKNYNKYKLGILIGSSILIVDSLYLMVYKSLNDLTTIGLVFGIIIYVGSFFAYIGIEKTAKDERLRKIGTMAATWSWYITLIFICFLLISMQWTGRIHNPIELMGLVVFVMVTTMLIANTMLSIVGDIE